MDIAGSEVRSWKTHEAKYIRVLKVIC